MKIMRVALLVIGISLVLNLQSGCLKAKKKTEQPSRIEPTPKTTRVTETSAKITEPPKRITEPPVRVTESNTEETPETGKAPLIEVKKPIFNIGSVGPNQKIKCEYVFKNIGDANLHITKILSPCQCVVAQLDKKDYAPGESGTIKIVYTSSSYEVPVQKHAHILSNDKKNPRFELTIKGKVEYKVQVGPKPINLFLNEENAGAQPITLKSKDGKPFSIRNFSCTQNVISVEFDPAVEKTEFVLKPIVDKEKLRKNLSGSVKIRLSHPETNQVNLSYASLPLYTISPPRFAVLDIQPGKVIDRILWVKSNYREKVEIDSITCMRSYMEITRREPVGNSIKLFVRITPPAQEGVTRRYLSDRLTIKMKDGEELAVPLSGWYSLRRPK
jgi:hypothetical protein